MPQRAQTAIEFISTYSFFFLIIAITLSLLFLFTSIPKKVVPFQCYSYGGFTCVDAVVANATFGSRVVLLLSASQPGVIRTSSFGAVLNYKSSINGYCSPNVISTGQLMICIADFNAPLLLGNLYSGTFSVIGNYCSNGPANISNFSCALSNQFLFGGALRVQVSNVVMGNTFNVPITINTFGIGGSSPANYQLPVSITPDLYSIYENPDLGNIRFMAGVNTLNSWCETNCSSISTGNALFWVQLSFQLSSPALTTINMIINPVNTEYDGVVAGESPIASYSYALHDNGNNVFPFYQRWGGLTAMPSGWTGNAIFRSTYAQFTTNTFTPAPPSVLGPSALVDFYGNMWQTASSYNTFVGLIQSGPPWPYVFTISESYPGFAANQMVLESISSGGAIAAATNYNDIDTNKVYTIWKLNPIYFYPVINYKAYLGLNPLFPPAPTTLEFGNMQQPITVFWVRTRLYYSYPAPVLTFNSLQKLN